VAVTIAEFGAKLERLVDGSSMRRVMAKAGQAGKKAALGAAADDLGGDRRFSNMRRKTALSAGYDDLGDTRVQINFRPAGLWKLAEDGRRKSGKIRPRGRSNGRRRAVMTPLGPRASSSYGPSRGLGTFTDANKDARREVPKAASTAFRDEIGRLF
jgi:hypothetical protein